MEELTQLVTALGPVGGTIVTVLLFMKFLKDLLADHRLVLEHWRKAQDKNLADVTQITREATTVMSEVSVHLQECSDSTDKLAIVMSRQSA